MRIWKGIEQEGNYKGTLTLFVESTVLDKHTLDIVLYCLSLDSVEQIYFGAGKVPVIYVDEKATEEIDNLKNSYLISIEEPIDMIKNLPKQVFDNIIGTVDIEELPNTVKLDTGKQVFCNSINNFISNELSTVENGIYKDFDVLVYEEE